MKEGIYDCCGGVLRYVPSSRHLFNLGLSIDSSLKYKNQLRANI